MERFQIVVDGDSFDVRVELFKGGSLIATARGADESDAIAMLRKQVRSRRRRLASRKVNVHNAPTIRP